MNTEDFKRELTSLGYEKSYDEEYHRTEFAKDGLVIFVDYHTIRFQWWYKPDRKIGTSFYIDEYLSRFKAAQEAIAFVMERLKAKMI